MTYRPAPQILPQHIKRLAVRPFANKTQQFGLEDKLTLRTIDEFLRNGEYPVVPELEADGIVAGEIVRYIRVTTQTDTALVPTAYKLTVIVNLDFIDRATNTRLWREENMVGTQTYAAPTSPGGMTEEQAREAVWDTLARDVATRVLRGFGSAVGESQRKFSPQPQTPPPQQAPPSP
jgi:hypothetical protein